MYSYQLKLRSGVELEDDGDVLLIASRDGRRLRIHDSGAGLNAILTHLVDGGYAAAQLVEIARIAEPDANAMSFHYLLARLNQRGFLSYTLLEGSRKLALLEPTSPQFSFQDQECTGALRFSRFGYIRREGSAMIVECPLGHARITLLDPLLCALPALLAKPQSIDEIALLLPSFYSESVREAVVLLMNAGAVFRTDVSDRVFEDQDQSLRLWEFHDLLFHVRSRSGRHEYPLGPTFRLKDTLPHPPMQAAIASRKRIQLAGPMPSVSSPDFFAVLESRRSRRSRGEKPLSLEQLGAFLWHTARTQADVPSEVECPESYGYQLRPYPSGGAIHELEIYLTVSGCIGLEQGLYHYDPVAHELGYLADMGESQMSLVRDAMAASGTQVPPDVLITLAARFGRNAWKYEGLSYSLIQKNVGCLYQQMYLVGTALGLSPCALGLGNSEHFCSAAGTSRYEESSVGEFMLSGADSLR
ncbi:SagB family peptide dehydrogenase [Congregibacter variabilis]|uniref:SagB family peptide dehydrogenase n=1 Tax=Congregibacter variabilis TaxID=3081200 RepID=A0ABZ0I1K3_9GAMM|nr:SagB family peptide dehydrogenase [Congregibacter sp. IMCC43200]